MFSLSRRTTEHRQSRLLLAAFALILAVLYDVFFWKEELGIGFFLFVLVYVVGFVLLLTYFRQIRQKWAFLLLVPIFVQAFDVALFNNKFISSAVPSITLVFLFLFSLLLPLHNPSKFRFSFMRIPLFERASIFFTKLGILCSDLFQSRSEKNKEITKKVLIALAISFPLLIIFGSLLSGADAIFSKWLQDVFDIDVEWNWIWRALRTFLLTLLFGGIFYVVTGQEHVLGFKDKHIKMFDTLIVSIILGLINLLFLAFVFIQIKYLFGSAHYVFDSGFTFAEYARAGFFQLVWVIALSALMMAIVYRSYSHSKAPGIITALQILLMVQVGIIAVSALKRMNLYQDAFGFTVLRLYVEWFIYFVLAVLVFAAVSIVSRLPFWKFFYGSIVAGVLALTIVASLNVDKLIAEENVRRFQQEGKSIDIPYLSKLSVDAAPTTLTLLLGTTEKFSLDDMLALQKVLVHTDQEVKNHDRFFEKNRGIREAAVFLQEKRGSLKALFEKMETQKNEKQNFESAVSQQRASWDSRSCLDQNILAQEGYFILDRICVPVIRSETERYLLVLLKEVNRQDRQLEKNDQYVYKILLEKTPGVYGEVFSKTFVLRLKSGERQSYENNFLLLKNGVLVQTDLKQYYPLFYKPLLNKENSSLGEEGKLTPSVLEQIKSL